MGEGKVIGIGSLEEGGGGLVAQAEARAALPNRLASVGKASF